MTIGDSDWIQNALARLVAIPSVSGSEQAAQQQVEAIMREAGAQRIRRVQVDPDVLSDRYGFSSPSETEGMHAVIGTWTCNLPGPLVVLNGHIDTVPASAGWSVDPHAAPLVDGRLTGLGSADMKAGLVSAIAAASRAAASGELRGTVEVQSVPDEEAGGGTGSLACVDSILSDGPRPDLVVVCEPTSLRIATAQVGSRSMAFTVTGVEAHANRKGDGVNAVEAAMELAGRLLAWVGTLRSEPDPLLPPRAVNIGALHGGDGATKVAATCDMEVCITYHPGDADAVVTEVDGIIESWRAGQDPRLLLTVRELHNVRPFSLDGTPPIVDALTRAVGDDAQGVGFPAGSDGRFFHDLLGVPTVLFGPGDIQSAHRPDESIAISEVVAHAEGLTRFLTDPAEAADTSRRTAGSSSATTQNTANSHNNTEIEER